MNTSCKIKICGITRLVDLQSAVKAGVDALGFVFYPASPRYVVASSGCDFVTGFATVCDVGGFVCKCGR